MNWKKLYRVYREAGVSVRKRSGRKRAVGTRTPMAILQGPNQRWSLDFMSDALADGRCLRILNVIDDFSRECLASVVDTSLSGERVARELYRIAETRGYLKAQAVDNLGPFLGLVGKVLPMQVTGKDRDPLETVPLVIRLVGPKEK